MGHLGLTQSIYKFGTYTVRAKEEEDTNLEDAKLLERLGCFAF
jgi:3-methyl-2-oxobutanoate hydroxymethyltransferase